ncbi:MAG: nucleotide exchange factor GrpE [Ignavibacteriaceae bacterium]
MKSKEDKINIEVKESKEEEILAEKTVEESAEENNQELKPAEAENALEQMKKVNVELNERLIRKVAEFENYKRRTESETANLLRYSGEFIVKKLLPVIDDLERSIKFINEPNSDQASVIAGITIVYEKLMKTLNEQGIKKIDAMNKPFDVDYHEAIMQQPTSEVEPLTVINEVETGYVYKDRVIRHAKVIVSSPDITQDL